MKKSFLIFQNGGFFPIAYFFSGKTVFLQISADFLTGFEKLFFPSESSSDKNVKKIKELFCSSSGFGNIREKQVSKTARCVFLLLTVQQQYCIRCNKIILTRIFKAKFLDHSNRVRMSYSDNKSETCQLGQIKQIRHSCAIFCN